MTRLTERDVRLLRDLVLSHALTRDQIIALGYFGSVTRANTRLRGLKDLGMVRALDNPFRRTVRLPGDPQGGRRGR